MQAKHLLAGLLASALVVGNAAAADISLLLQTQVGVTAMQTRSIAARYDYLTALSNLQRAKGELGEDAHRSQ